MIFNTILDTIFSKRLSEKEAFFIFGLFTENQKHLLHKEIQQIIEKPFWDIFTMQNLKL